MNIDDKEFILEVLDEITAVLALHAFEETSPEIWNKMARAITIVERSCYTKNTSGDSDDGLTNERFNELDFSDGNDPKH